MPVPIQRDPDLTRARLAAWLATVVDADGVTVGPLTVPPTSGFSAEILLCEASWRAGGRRITQPLVVRVAPTRHRIFPDPRWRVQVEVQRALADTDVPVAPIIGYDAAGTWLGAPFVVMRRIEGQVPADLPSYHRDGWLTALSPPRRRQLWWGAVELLGRIHRLAPERVAPPGTRIGLDAGLRFFADHLEYFGADRLPVVHQALGWLREHRPPEPGGESLLWGDARLGNLIFAGTRPVAVLDWEMVDIGRPETDLAWFLYLDRFLSEGIGAPRLAGLPSRDETVARYELISGRPVEHLDYFEVYAAFRFCVLTARVARLLGESGIVAPGADFPLHRNATGLLRRRLAEASALVAPAPLEEPSSGVGECR